MARGVTTHVGFRPRPISPEYAIFTQVQQAQKYARSYQRQHLSLAGSMTGNSVAVGAFGDYSEITFMPGDLVVAATYAVLINSGATTYDVEINGTLRGAGLGGTWSLVPNHINIKPFALPNANSLLLCRVKNVSGALSTINTQLVVVVLR